jgi:hypothetical protein
LTGDAPVYDRQGEIVAAADDLIAFTWGVDL